MKDRFVRDVIRTTSTTLLLGLALGCSSAFARGTGDIGGGAGVVCRDGQQNVTSVELLDIAEGKKRGFVIPSQSAGVDEQTIAIAKRLQAFAHFQDYRQSSLSDVLAEFREKVRMEKEVEFTDSDEVLHTPFDLGRNRALRLKNGCRIESIGYYEEGGKLVVSKLLYDKMDNSNKAAFWVHESIYALVRRRSFGPVPVEAGTEGIRDLVAALFASNTKLENLAKAFRPLALAQERELSTYEGAKAPMIQHGIIPVAANADNAQIGFFLENDFLSDDDRARTQPETKEEFTASDARKFHCGVSDLKGAAFTLEKKIPGSMVSTLQTMAIQFPDPRDGTRSARILVLPSSCFVENRILAVVYLAGLKGKIVLLRKTGEKGAYSMERVLVDSNGDAKVPYIIRVDFLGAPALPGLRIEWRNSDPAAVRAGAAYPWSAP